MTPRRPTVSKPQLLVDGNDHTVRSFIHDFLAFSAIVSDIRAGFGERLGMTGIAYTTLISIAYLQGRAGIGVNAVAEHLHLSGAFITTEVATFVRAGLVHKGVNAKDKAPRAAHRNAGRARTAQRPRRRCRHRLTIRSSIA